MPLPCPLMDKPPPAHPAPRRPARSETPELDPPLSDTGSERNKATSEPSYTTHSSSETASDESAMSPRLLSRSESSDSLVPKGGAASKKKKRKKEAAPSLYPRALKTEKPKTRKPVKPASTIRVSQEQRDDVDADGYFRVCELSDLPVKGGVKVKVSPGGQTIALFRTATGRLHAIANKCTHQGVGLACGDLIDIEDTSYVKCPGHNVKFNLQTGRSRGKWKQKVYSVKAKEGYACMRL